MRKILVVVAAATAFPLVAHAQDTHAMAGDMAGMAHGDSQLPAACNAAASADTSATMDGEGSIAPRLDEVQKANRDAMMTMHEPMMKAATIKDPDLAFNCGMIAHHQGAIAMSEVELRMGKDETSRALARAIIDAQKEEIAQMTARIEALVK